MGIRVKYLATGNKSLLYARPDARPALGRVPAVITPHFTDKETAAQRGSCADPRSHSQGKVDTRRCRWDTELQVSLKRKSPSSH